MGQIANQMFIEMLCKISSKIQNSKEQRKNCNKADEADKKSDKAK